MKNNKTLNLIKPFLKDCKAYVVGGFLRDYFLGKNSYDCDITINCNQNVSEFVKNIADKIGATFVPLHEDFEIYRIVLHDKKTYYDFAKIEGKNIFEDLSRRDLTINAIAYDINNEKFLDPYGGIEDIKNKKIKAISEKNIIDDPLRIMRIFRFSTVLGFEIEDETLNLVKKHSKLINTPAKERLTYEFMKMFGGNKVAETLLKMDGSGVLEEVFPYYKEIKKIPKNSHHHLDLFHHLVESVNQIEKIIASQPNEIKEYFEQDFGSATRLAYIKLASFLHDFGKPSTWTIEPDIGRHRFIGHDVKGAEMIKPVLKDLKFSKKQTDYISNMIKYHIYPSQLASDPNLSEKAKLRFYNKLKDEVIDVIMIAHADRNSALGPMITKEMIEQNKKGLDSLLTDYFKERNRLKDMPPLLNGYEIMEILNIGQSKELGNIVKALYKAQVEKTVNTKDEAVEFVKIFFTNKINTDKINEYKRINKW